MSAASVLVVEDNPQTRKLLRVTLESQGYTVLEAADGHDAVELARQDPDMIIQDLLLPDVDGLVLREQMRGATGRDSTPVIAISGFSQRLFCPEADRAGFSDRLLKPVEPSRLISTVRSHLPVGEEAGRSGAARVLVADDNDIQRKLTVLRLRGEGFEVLEAEDGDAAVRVARDAKPDVVLSDVLMPGLDGFDVCRTIRSSPEIESTPIVLASSAFIERADRELAASAGADRFVVRDPDLVGVIDAVRGALAGRPHAHAQGEAYDALHARRLSRQLALQAAETNVLTARCARQHAQLVVMSGISEALARETSIDVALDEVLARCLEASGLDFAALYVLAGPDDALELRSCAGVPIPVKEQALREALSAEKPLAEGGLLVAALSHGTTRLGVAVMGTLGGVLGDEQIVIASALSRQIGQAAALAAVQNELVASREATVIRLVHAIELRDGGTAEHTRRMSDLCVELAALAGIDPAEREHLRVASVMHDIGKVATPDAILLKPGTLTPEEFEVIKQHTEIGHELLKGSGSDLLDLAAEIAWTHHEHWNGGGYPRGLSGETIPLEGRIAAIADVYDALTSDRPYRPAMSEEETVAIMRSGRGTQFQPDLLDAFLDALPEITARHEQHQHT